MVKSKIYMELIACKYLNHLSPSNQQTTDRNGFLEIVFLILKLTGCFPFDKDFDISLTLLIYSVSIQVSLTSGFLYLNYFRSDVPKDDSQVEHFVKNTIVFQLGLGLTVYFFSVLWKRRELAETAKEMNVNNDWIGPDVKRYYTSYIVATIMEFLLCLLIILFDYFNNDFNLIASRLCWLYLCFYIKQFTALLQTVRYRLERLLSNIDNRFHLERAAERYNAVRRQCRSINSVYSLTLVLYSLCLFCQLVVTAYKCSLLSMTYLVENEVVISEITSAGLSLMQFVVNMLHIAHECSSVTSKSVEFNNALYHKMMEEQIYRNNINERLRLHISTNRDIIFTACDFFPLDYTLAHSMVAATTTYVVILIQLGPTS